MVVVVDKVVSGSCLSSSSSLLLLPLANKSAKFYDNNKSVVAISSGRIRRRSGSLRCLSSSSSSHSQNINSNRNSNYVVSFDSSSCITRPLAEILRDLNKRIPDNIITTINKKKPSSSSNTNTNTNNNTLIEDQDQVDDADIPSKPTYSIPWYHANRMLSFYAPGWCGEIRDVIFSDDASVTVVYRVTIRGSDGEAHRESTGTVSPQMNNNNNNDVDAVAAAEEIAFCRACARFGLGLYLYHDE